MKEIKKHIHGITGALLFLFSGFVILLLAGFTTPLPLPEEEAVLIDFSVRSGADNNSSGSNNTDAEKESLSTEKLLVQNFENSEFVHSDGQADNKSEANTDKINNLFKNPFNNGFGDKEGDNGNPDNGHGDKNGPGDIAGKLDGNRSVEKVDPVARENSFGKVVLEVTVNESGYVTEVRLVSSTCNDCVQPAKDAVKKWKYQALPGSGFQTGIVVIEFRQN